jgi:hypothetical protein
MEAIGEWLGVDYSPDLVHNFKDYENFAISGNMMRWRESDDDIRLDERWKTELPGVYQHLVHGLTVPFRRFCGYAQVEARL